MVELAVHQKPLHQVDVFLAGSAGAAERAALDCCNHFYTCLRRLARLVQVTRMLFAGRGQGADVRVEGVRWSNGGDQTRSQDFRTWNVHSVKLATSTGTASNAHGFTWFITAFLFKFKHLIDTKSM